jgi:hemerythrin-like metal-binding protein
MTHPANGHPEINEGHDRVLALLEKLRYNPWDLDGVVRELVECFRSHCRDEESLMRSRKFRGLEAHAAEHKAMTAHFAGGLLEDLRNAGTHDGVQGAVDRAQQMLADHIQCRDLELALFLARKPPKGRPRKAPGKKPRA